MSELEAYDYSLPKHLIAQQPLSRRQDAKLLVVDRASREIRHRHVRDLWEILMPGDLLVCNDTRVVPARLVGTRTLSGGRWEGLFLSETSEGHWRMLAKTRGKIAPGETVTLLDKQARGDVRLRLIERLDDGTWLAHPENEESAPALLDRVGRVPLPHYIRDGEMVDADRQNYQTVFARRPGAVAAPTAGLHFTADLLRKLHEAGIENTQITLHVGPDTFRPIKSDRLAAHAMHSEWGEITRETVERIEACRQAGGRVIAVGTTTVRVLETASAGGTLQPWKGETTLFIRPPYTFKTVDALLTNFHLPRTTLLVLVHAFGGEKLIRQAYDEAIREEYRFFSYGDAMLVE